MVQHKCLLISLQQSIVIIRLTRLSPRQHLTQVNRNSSMTAWAGWCYRKIRKQSALNNYSYTKYDNLGRITEVGQIRSSETMDRSVSRTQSQIDLWFTPPIQPEQKLHRRIMTRDIMYHYLRYFLQVICATGFRGLQCIKQNLMLTPLVILLLPSTVMTSTAMLIHCYRTIKAGWTAATGLKIVYDYDLISGKVNQVSYQPGKLDQFYHRVYHDAENRLTDVETSSDQLYWEHDAFYNYYKQWAIKQNVCLQAGYRCNCIMLHPLQGWLKGINSTSLMTGDDMGGDGKSAGGVASNPVAKGCFGVCAGILWVYGLRAHQ